MNQVLKERSQIKVKKLNLGRDNLVEWLLQNMEDNTIARLYITDHYALIGIDKEVLNKEIA